MQFRITTLSLRTLTSALIIPFLVLSLFLPSIVGGPPTAATSAALSWLITHRLSVGSYGGCSEIQTAPAAYALWLAYNDAPNVTVSYTFLKNQMDNSTTYFWSGGACSPKEADIPGEILYSFDASQNVARLNMTFVGPKLLSFQQKSGGFLGYEDSGHPVTSSIDTSMALWGLINAGAIPASNQTAAVNYLLALQNSDGSFNLTRTVRSTTLYSLGPEPISLTALVVRVLRDAGLTTADSHVASALNFLNNAATTNFGGHVYAASFATLAFTAFGQTASVSNAVNFIVTQQNSDGGFADSIRSSTTSNALDTGWATIALQAVPGSGSVGGSMVPTNLSAWLLLAAVLVTVVLLVGAVLRLRRVVTRHPDISPALLWSIC